jgi:hypothetical protein
VTDSGNGVEAPAGPDLGAVVEGPSVAGGKPGHDIVAVHALDQQPTLRPQHPPGLPERGDRGVVLEEEPQTRGKVDHDIKGSVAEGEVEHVAGDDRGWLAGPAMGHSAKEREREVDTGDVMAGLSQQREMAAPTAAQVEEPIVLREPQQLPDRRRLAPRLLLGVEGLQETVIGVVEEPGVRRGQKKTGSLKLPYTDSSAWRISNSVQ